MHGRERPLFHVPFFQLFNKRRPLDAENLRRLILGDAFDTKTRLARLSMPLLVVHGRKDQLVAYAFGRELFESYAGEKSFLTIADDHNLGYLLSGDAYRDGIAVFAAGWVNARTREFR